MPMRAARTSPLVVSTPTTRPASRTNPVTSQVSQISTLSALAARAQAKATASCRAVPARGWFTAPQIGKRASAEKFRIGARFCTSVRVSNSASTPFNRIAFVDRTAISISLSEWARTFIPRG
jgi:hypothetical protein